MVTYLGPHILVQHVYSKDLLKMEHINWHFSSYVSSKNICLRSTTTVSLQHHLSKLPMVQPKISLQCFPGEGRVFQQFLVQELHMIWNLGIGSRGKKRRRRNTCQKQSTMQWSSNYLQEYYRQEGSTTHLVTVGTLQYCHSKQNFPHLYTFQCECLPWKVCYSSRWANWMEL